MVACGTGLVMDKMMHWAGGLWGQDLAMPVHMKGATAGWCCGDVALA